MSAFKPGSPRSSYPGVEDTGAFALLSEPPARVWPDGVLHHGARIALMVLLAIVLTLLFPPSPGIQVTRYEVGSVADADVIASLTFEVPKNRDELERERQGAAASVPPTFVLDVDAEATMLDGLDRFFEEAGRVAQVEGDELQILDAVSWLLEDRGMTPTPERLAWLRDPRTRATTARLSETVVRELLPRGVLDDAARIEPGIGRILVMEPDGSERYVLRESVLTSREFFQAASARAAAEGIGPVEDLLRLLLIHFFTPSLRYDLEATERDRDAARRAVPTSRATVLQGEAIVRANQVVTEGEVERLRAFEEALRSDAGAEAQAIAFLPLLGRFLLNLLLLGIFATYLFLFRSEIYRNARWVLLQALLILTFFGVAALIARQGLAPELLPIAFITLAAAVLWDGRIALALALTVAALTGAQAPFQGVNAWLPVFVAGGVAALSVRAVRRRSQTWIFIAVIAGAYLGVILSLGLLTGRELPRIAEAFGWAAGNTVVSAILAMGFLPVFEWFTRITTDQTLLEWADPNRPLLKRLSVEAPGTYAHTIQVANLSEAAANAIGASGLLCRVGVYYHDVGKMLKPQYFIENQPGGHNPHDRLKPATSAAIVREHVTEGVRLAREANLPDVLVSFIPEHHGTQEISYFLAKAKEGLGAGEQLDLESFRYPGPKPQRRETAIVMLADSVESATRTLQDPTPERVRDLVETIVEGKIRAGQLDEAPLTLRELRTIKEAFLKVLSGVYHQRIEYPETRHLTEAPVGDSDNEA